MVNLSQNILTTDEQYSVRCVPPAELERLFLLPLSCRFVGLIDKQSPSCRTKKEIESDISRVLSLSQNQTQITFEQAEFEQ